MTPSHSFARTLSIGLVVLTLGITGLASSFAVPNVTDLQSFRGRTTGTAKVAIGSDSFSGKSKIRVIVTAPTAAKIKINAAVESNAGSVPLDNELTFTSAGEFRGKELAPGVTSGSPFKGDYTAAAGRIIFQGTFKIGSTKGTFSGSAAKSPSGKLKITYSIFIGTNPEASYIYTYVGK